MAHPNDAALRITLGRHLDEMLVRKVESLIRKPDERAAGYIDALRDIQRIILLGDDPPPIVLPTPPTQE